MEDKAAQIRAEKELVAQLIDRWARRMGLRLQDLATQAGFAEYNLFYKAYLDMSRGVSADPEYALGVIRVVTNSKVPSLQATAAEALHFLARTRLPLDRLAEVYPLFPAEEWQDAASAVLGISGRGTAHATTEADLRQHLERIDAALAQLVGSRSIKPRDHEALLQTMPDIPPAPAPLPIPHRVPFAPGRLFTGRDEEISVLMRLLRTQQIGEAVAITGIGGIGKTSLSSEIAHRIGRYFAGGVFWLSCAEPMQIAREMAACGESGLVQSPGWATLTPEERVRLVSLAFQAPMPRLLILDNCEEEALLQQWRPTSGGCRVLLTSRRAQWSRSLGVTTLALKELDQATSVTLLHRYRPDLPTTDEHLHAIAHELGGLPLALHLAGSFLEVYQSDPVFGDPGRLFSDLRSPGPLAHTALQGVDVAGTTTRHDLHLGRTFATSLERLNPQVERDAFARTLLVRATCLAPGEPFPAELLLTAAGMDDKGRSAVRRLADLGLLSESIGVLRIHRLIQEFAHAMLNPGRVIDEMCHAIAQLTERIYDQRDIPSARLLLVHAVHLVNSVDRDDEATITLWNAVPFLLDMSGDLASGLPYLERAHARLVSAGVLETPLGAEVLNNLAEWRRALGEEEQVRDLHLQALAIRQRLFAPDSLTIAESHANIGDTLREQGDFAGARDHYEQALEIALKSGGSTHNITLVVQGQLALLYYHQRQFTQARDALAELVPIHVVTFGPDDPRTAIVRNNYAMALFQLGEFVQARQELNQGIATLQQTLGDDHAETLRGRLNAARAAVRLGEHQQAVAELQRIIGPLAAVYGDASPVTQLARDTLAEAEARLADEADSASAQNSSGHDQ